jgi:hypothetical protein
MQRIAQDVKTTKIVPRPDQLADMFVLLTFTERVSLLQKPTGTGKAVMFGLISAYVYKKLGQKVAVIVPTDTLAAVHQRYCSYLCRALDALEDTDVPGVFYCTYADFLEGKIPHGFFILVDEIDSIFFTDKPRIENGKFVSAVLLMNKYQKCIGMTATFRGE